MNKIFSFIFIISLFVMLIICPDKIMNVIFSATEKAITLSFSLISIYAFWLGILEICEKTGISGKLAKLLSKPIDFLFNKPDKETKKQIAINISSNILGMGNAATPSGIKAMQGLDSGTEKINKSQMLFMLLNTSSLQIIPTTIIGVRIANASTNATSIVLPTILASFISTICGVLLLFLIEKIKKGKKKWIM